MKKFLIVLCALLLCSCAKSPEKKLAELGYSESQIEKIFTLSDETQGRFFENYDEKLVHVISNSAFEEKHLDDYLHFEGKLDEDLMFELVNRDMLTDDNCQTLSELYTSPFFVAQNEALYLQYLGEYETVRDTIEIVNTRRYLPLFEDIQVADTSYEHLLLVNKYYQLPEDYEPEDLVEVEGARSIVYLREAVAEAYSRLLKDARSLGYNLIIASAYRSYNYQEGLYAKYLGMDTRENVDTYSARPGHSEHQSGLCIDVTIPGYSIDDFYLTDAADWLAEHCYDYGFIIRYEMGKEDITGYQAEPWQIRYVGDKAAQEIKEYGITFDEYWECFVRR